ncbi:ATP-dependent helicase HrpB [Marinibactrum halimedae]|uniref:ATP-dependent helicase HrpB n=1 Tax=Marinibactrum halimedae TaxID=1444977 RepID=A0AA37T2I7_9GAMM|nr:ATP-dependent helicase HrpB [Marinibactrum halimedae]MCD9459652.1 ATP-dependent helicase HrpB [Marinibactrum halimedae]GLS25679.1 ATP-dependent helicase HrpB [Marinibactrum halimedae]
MTSLPQLPISDVLTSIEAFLSGGDELVLEAPPGAGKTTIVPLSLLGASWLNNQKIVVLEPRRLAAKVAAERMADILGESVGQTVGYRVRFESKVSQKTKIEVVTEGILIRQLQDDPALSGVGVVIFDEFHERSVDADLALALSLQGRDLFGDVREVPLKIVVMSATLNGQAVSQLLSEASGQLVPVVTSEGRAFPVDVQYCGAYEFGEDIRPKVERAVNQAIAQDSGSILVFLPGVGEIRSIAERLEDAFSKEAGIVVCPLYGDLTLAAQHAAIRPAPEGVRKIVLATNIAETSLTIEGVRVVIDGGLVRYAEFDPVSGVNRLVTGRVSRAEAEQRAGRAGRMEPGVCYRLWSKSQHDSLAEQPCPEILQSDLAPLAIQLARWGVSDPSELLWLDPPATGAWQQACELLKTLDVLKPAGFQLSTYGECLSSFPLHPRQAHLLAMSHLSGHGELGVALAALLESGDRLPSGQADLASSVFGLMGQGEEKGGKRFGSVQSRKMHQQLDRLRHRRLSAEKIVKTDVPLLSAFEKNASDDDALGVLLALAYPDRIAQRRNTSGEGASYKLSNGRGVRLKKDDRLSRNHYLVVAELGGGQSYRSPGRDALVFAAIPLSESVFQTALSHLVKEKTDAYWDTHKQRFCAQRQWCIGELVIRSEPIAEISNEIRQSVLLSLIRKEGLSILSWSPSAIQWRARVALLNHIEPDGAWPDVSDKGLLSSLEIWFGSSLTAVSTLNQLKDIDLLPLLKTLLPWPLPQQLDDQLPAQLSVPSGRSHTIDYTQSPPVLAVRMQEMFGCANTPSVAGGRIPLMLHLLSPAQRPLQVTQDLSGFWGGVYREVAKEMRGRYPKHYWPDNPLESEATARAKPRK